MILQFAKSPPPIGGITIHIKRLVAGLKDKESIDVEILDYSRERNFKVIFIKIFRAKVIHIHLSRESLRFFFVILFKLLFKKVIITFHGKKDFSNKFDLLSILIANKSIVLNKFTLNKAKKITNKVIQIGAFLPPLNMSSTNSLNKSSIVEIEKMKAIYNNCFSINAWKVVFDQNKQEIYGGSLLVEIFKESSNIGLVFSDPTGQYKEFLTNKFKVIPENILFINYSHDFIDVINITDCTIRSTTTDGDPLSVKESLYFNKDAICSNIIERPIGAIVYFDKSDLEEKLINYNSYQGEFKKYIHEDNLKKLTQIYQTV